LQKKIEIHNFNFSGCLYGCETWSVTLREELRARVLENTVLRKIPGGKRDEATGEWRRMLSGELHDLYSRTNIIRVLNENTSLMQLLSIFYGMTNRCNNMQ